MGLAGRGAMPLPPMPGDGAGRGGVIDGVTGLGAAGAGAAGFGDAGFAAAAGLRAGALRAGFRAVFFAVLRAAVFRAGAFFFTPVFFAAVLRALLFLVPARPALALFFLLVVRFFPLFFVAMACAPILF